MRIRSKIIKFLILMNQDDKEFIGLSPCPLRLTQLNRAYSRELDGSLAKKNLEALPIMSTGSSLSEWSSKHPCELFEATGRIVMPNLQDRVQPWRMCKKNKQGLKGLNSNVFD